MPRIYKQTSNSKFQYIAISCKVEAFDLVKKGRILFAY